MLAVHWDDCQPTRSALLDVRSSSSCWQSMTSAAVVRSYHALVAVGEYSVVMLGGDDGNLNRTDSAQLYDTRADRWTERAEWRLPTPSFSHFAIVIE